MMWCSSASAATTEVADAAALSTALVRSAAGDVVAMAPGTYPGPFTVPAGVVLRGAGAATVLTATGGDVLVLSGPSAGLVTRVESLTVDGAGDARGLLVHQDAELEDVVIRRVSADRGAAVTVDGATALTVRGSSWTDGRSGSDGGLLSAAGGSRVTLVDTDLSYGVADERGGAIYTEGASLSLEGVRITGNRATVGGGGVWSTGAVLDWRDVVVADNLAGDPRTDNYPNWADEPTGGGVAVDQGSLTASVLTLERNTATVGGGMWVSEAVVSLSAWALLDNVATERGGGADWVDARALEAEDGEVRGNVSWFGGGIAVRGEGQPARLVRVSFCANALRAGVVDAGDALGQARGGAVWVDGATVELTNALLLGNDARADGDGVGGAVAVTGAGSARLRQDVLAWNAATDGAAVWAATDTDVLVNGVAVAWSADAPAMIASGTWTATWSAFYGNRLDVGLEALLDETNLVGPEPGFLDPDPARCEPGAWLPEDGSPLIDGGDPSLSDPDGSRADIGLGGGPDAVAEERSPSPVPEVHLRRDCGCAEGGSDLAGPTGALALTLARRRRGRGRPRSG